MRSLLAAAIAAATVAAASPSAEACSIRGRYCGYPAWAANAFEGAKGSVILGSGPVLRLGDHAVRGYGYGRAHGYAPRRHSYRRARR